MVVAVVAVAVVAAEVAVAIRMLQLEDSACKEGSNAGEAAKLSPQAWA